MTDALERWTPKSATAYEQEGYFEDGRYYLHKVRVQYCEYQDSGTGLYCNKYLGYEYPSEVCREHRGDQNG